MSAVSRLVAVPASERSRPSDGPFALAQEARFGSTVETTVRALSGRYAALIVWSLFWAGKSFYELLRSVPGMGRNALSRELDDLERKGLVRVERQAGAWRIALTAHGQSLKLVVGVMHEWGLLALRDPELRARLDPTKPPGLPPVVNRDRAPEPQGARTDLALATPADGVRLQDSPPHLEEK